MTRVLLVAAVLAAAGAVVDARQHLVTRDAYLMGTRVHLAVYAAGRAEGMATLDTALRVLEDTDRELSTWRDDSAISALNRHPVGRPWQAPPATCRMLASAFEWQRVTSGTFDPAIGRLIAAWDIHGAGRIPSAEALSFARDRSGSSHVSLDKARCEVTRHADAAIDVGGFGKGEALDRVEAALGPGAWLIDLGGQVSVGGPQPDGRSWVIDVADPAVREEARLQVTLDEGSLSTSGGSERDAVVNGAHVAHVLDPRTGRPASFRGSVTVRHRSALAADALSTALYVMGPEEGVRWADRRGIAAVFLIPEGAGVRAEKTAAWK